MITKICREFTHVGGTEIPARARIHVAQVAIRDVGVFLGSKPQTSSPSVDCCGVGIGFGLRVALCLSPCRCLTIALTIRPDFITVCCRDERGETKIRLSAVTELDARQPTWVMTRPVRRSADFAEFFLIHDPRQEVIEHWPHLPMAYLKGGDSGPFCVPDFTQPARAREGNLF